jgi:hypothetical protein
MKRISLFCLAIVCCTSVLAALPPYYQTSKEIITILNNKEVSEKIGSGRPIHSIVHTDSGYLIQAGECSLAVKVTYSPRPNGMVGPAVFEIHVDQLECKK